MNGIAENNYATTETATATATAINASPIAVSGIM